jgi:hypothetical protein
VGRGFPSPPFGGLPRVPHYSMISQLQQPPFGSLQCGTLPGLRLWQKVEHCASVQQPGPMRQAGGRQKGSLATAGLEARAVVARTMAISNNLILFFIGDSFQVWDLEIS